MHIYSMYAFSEQQNSLDVTNSCFPVIDLDQDFHPTIGVGQL
jgi:hypothetical protein